MPKMTELISKVKANPTSALWKYETSIPRAAIAIKPGGVEDVDYWKNLVTKDTPWNGHKYDAIIRYGCTINILKGVPILNKARAIHTCYNKIKTRGILAANDFSIVHNTDNRYPKVVRPGYHHKGLGFLVVFNKKEEEDKISEYIEKYGSYYIMDFIDVAREIRIHASANGFLLLGQKKVAKKKINKYSYDPDLPEFLAMNFNELKNYGYCCSAVKAIGLDFGAIDIIVDQNGKEYISEINSAPYAYKLLKKVYKAYFEEWIKSGYKFPQLETPEIFMKKERLEGLFAS